MALIREIDGNTVLGLARINRRGKVTVDGWQQLNLTQQSASPSSAACRI